MRSGPARWLRRRVENVAVVLMAVASHFIAKLLVKYPWITWIGLLVILYVAMDMIYDGGHEVACKGAGIGCQADLITAVRAMLRL